jgi:hypothetical protein
VLKPGGFLALSTPNLVWWPLVKAAAMARLRPFDGLENFSTWRSLSRTFEKEDLDIVEGKGLHLFPFQLGLHGLSEWADRNCQFARAAMINICLLGQKKENGTGAPPAPGDLDTRAPSDQGS